MDSKTMQECRDFVLNMSLQRKHIDLLVKEKLLCSSESINIINRQDEIKPFFNYIEGDMDKMYDTPVDFYTKVNITRQVYHNMQKKDYDPDIRTVYKVAIGLEYGILEAIFILEQAGYSLTLKSKEQLIMVFCFINCVFKPSDVDELLVDQKVKPLFAL